MSSKEPILPPNERCPECKGKGRVRCGWRLLSCTRCHGRGKCELKQRPISPPPPPPPKKMTPHEYCAKVARAEPVAIDCDYPRHLAKLVREILADEAKPIRKAKPRKHPDPTVEVPIELIRSLAVKAWMRNDIATADLLYGLLGETTATAHERSDE